MYDFLLAGTFIVVITAIFIALLMTVIPAENRTPAGSSASQGDSLSTVTIAPNQSIDKPMHMLEINANKPLSNAIFIFELALGFFYFGWFWTRGGQTIGMKVWKVKLINKDGRNMGWGKALLRYGLAMLSWGIGAIGILWILIDKDKQPLHDRLLGTRMILLKAK